MSLSIDSPFYSRGMGGRGWRATPFSYAIVCLCVCVYSCVSRNFTCFAGERERVGFSSLSLFLPLFVWFFDSLFYWAHFICSSLKLLWFVFCCRATPFDRSYSFTRAMHRKKRNWAIENLIDSEIGGCFCAAILLENRRICIDWYALVSCRVFFFLFLFYLFVFIYWCFWCTCGSSASMWHSARTHSLHFTWRVERCVAGTQNESIQQHVQTMPQMWMTYAAVIELFFIVNLALNPEAFPLKITISLFSVQNNFAQWMPFLTLFSIWIYSPLGMQSTVLPTA